jgi:hypothetical protein
MMHKIYSLNQNLILKENFQIDNDCFKKYLKQIKKYFLENK